MPKPRRRKAPQPLVQWQHVVQEVAYVERADGRSLVLLIQTLADGHSVLALDGKVAGNKHALDVLDDHAHHVVAKDVSERVARRLATEYVTAWVKHKRAAPNCPCDEIEIHKTQSKAKASKR